jgi:hypothetical protein
MYKCKLCNKEFDLTSKQYDILVLQEKEVVVTCPCGQTSFIVGADINSEGNFEIYSRDFVKCFKNKDCMWCSDSGKCEVEQQMIFDREVIEVKEE